MLVASLVATFVSFLAGGVFLENDVQGLSGKELVRAAQNARVEMIQKVAPSVVCVFDRLERGGGSGVLISEDGFGLTNFHVVAGLMGPRKGLGGLGDGVLYELEVLGVDMSGDIAMFRLIPPKEPYRFPHSRLGDSDSVKLGDAALAMGNPFSLSEDYSPTVTRGIVTGISRYQAGVKGNLTYTDCIQVDAAINPGNSGGPLFNLNGEVIGINGRISVNTRGRYNVGFGYAISSNQIKRFLPALRAGLLARHGAWQATVDAAGDGRIIFHNVRRAGAAGKAGIRDGDELLGVDGVKVHSVNQVLSLLGTYPGDWPVLVRIRRGERVTERVVHLRPYDPRMRRPFLADWRINQREVVRVLEAFHRVTFGPAGSATPLRGRWRIKRDHHPVRADEWPGESQQFEVTAKSDEAIRLQELQRGDPSGAWIDYDARNAFRRLRTEGDSVPLSSEQRSVHVALFHMQRTLLTSIEDIDLSKMHHVGGDAVVTPLPPESMDMRPLTPRRRIDWPMLEVLELGLGDQSVARYGFDAITHELMRITIVDTVTGGRTTIELSDYRQVDHLHWPIAMEVKTADSHYCDEWTDWELSK